VTDRPARVRAGTAVVPPRLRWLQAADRRVGGQLCRRVPVRYRGGRGERADPVAVRGVLLIRPGGLGDAVLTWPLLAALRTRFPGARVDVLAEARNAGAWTLAGPAAPVIFRYDRRPLGVFLALRRRRYDLVVDTEQYHHFSALLANALRPRWICGFDTLGRSRLHTHGAPHDEASWEARAFLRLAEAIGAGPAVCDPDAPFVPLDDTARLRARELLGSDDSPVAALIPAAGSNFRIWPAARYAELGRWFARQGYRIAILGGPDAVGPAARICADAGAGVIDLAGRTSLAETAGVLDRCRVAVTADTGVLHLAVGVGTRTVGLFGPGRHAQWGAPGARHRIVRLGLDCSPCIRGGRLPPCPYDIACMRDLPVAMVTEAIESVLG